MPTFSLLFLPPIKSSIHEEFWGFSVGSRETASTDGGTGNRKHKDIAKEGPCDSEKSSKRKFSGLESKSEEDESEQNPINKRSKNKRNRRKERKGNKSTNNSLKIYGVNCAGLMNKIHSFENVLKVKMPSVFCLQETKLKKPNQIKTESTKKFTIMN